VEIVMENAQQASQLKRFKKIQALAQVEDLWAESLAAEERGDLARALEIQEQIVLAEDSSYASVFRMAWLYYCAGDLQRSLEYYQKAWEVSEGREWPLYGLRNCYQALGDLTSVNLVTQRIQLFNTAADDREKSVQTGGPQQLSRDEKDCLLMA
jgi:tetratricopeptide (TPR) repeat protein